jgi:hypothetical protein
MFYFMMLKSYIKKILNTFFNKCVNFIRI